MDLVHAFARLVTRPLSTGILPLAWHGACLHLEGHPYRVIASLTMANYRRLTQYSNRAWDWMAWLPSLKNCRYLPINGQGQSLQQIQNSLMNKGDDLEKSWRPECQPKKTSVQLNPYLQSNYPYIRWCLYDYRTSLIKAYDRSTQLATLKVLLWQNESPRDAPWSKKLGEEDRPYVRQRYKVKADVAKRNGKPLLSSS